MIELNLLEKKEPLKLPSVLGFDLNQINIVMLIVAIVIWYLPQSIYDSMLEGKVQEDAQALALIKERADKINQEIGDNGKAKETLKAYQEQVEKLKLRSTQVDEILKVRTNPKKILEKIARSVPEDIWFESLQIDEKSEINITGGSYNSRSLGEFITIINDSPYFAGSIIPVKQENKQENFEGFPVSYDYFEVKGQIKSYDMRVK